MMCDSWGCEGDTLFGGLGQTTGFGFGPAKSLTELVDGLSANKFHSIPVDKKLSFPEASALSENCENVQVIPCWQSQKNGNGVHAKKILKKKSSINKANKEPSLKRVSFELEQLIAREAASGEKEELQKRLVVSLGGAPPKGPQMNLKQLKEKRVAEKTEEERQKLHSTMHQIIGKKKSKGAKKDKKGK